MKIEIIELDLDQAYAILQNETDKMKQAYYWGYVHCLQTLHKQGYFTEDSMIVSDFLMRIFENDPRATN